MTSLVKVLTSKWRLLTREDPLYVVAQSLSSNYESPAIDVSEWKRGYIQISWAGYDGINGAINIQISEDNTIWDDWGGLSGALVDISAASGNQPFELTTIQSRYVRFKFYIGNGTTGTVTSSYLLRGES